MKTNESADTRFAASMSRLIRRLNLLNRDQKVCYGLTLPQCGAVETLYRRGKLPMKDLSQEMGVTISTMTRVIDILVRDGIVTRKENPDDRRKVCIGLTGNGRMLALKLQKCSLDYSREILNLIPLGEQILVLNSLELLNRAIESMGKRCCE